MSQLKIISVVFISALFIFGFKTKDRDIVNSTKGQNINKIKRPNIIFIMTDDQSPIVPTKIQESINKKQGARVQSRAFGFNGDKAVYTPIIDDLAKGGIIFNRAYVSSSVCSPSRYSILTGRYAGRSEGNKFKKLYPLGQMSRVENNVELEIDKENLPRLLQKAGYRTGFVGKSHVIDHHIINETGKSYKEDWESNNLIYYKKNADPNNPEINKAMSNNHFQWAERIKKYGFDYANGIYAANLRELFNDSLRVHNVEWKNKAALDFIDSSSKNTPFFLYYSETIPHGPAPWTKKKGKYIYSLDANPKFTGAGLVEEDYSYLPTRSSIKAELEALGKDINHAWLRWFDHAVGAVVKKLKEKGMYENTIIIITSDHGNYNFGKSTIYESGVKVPLMMHWPNGIKSNSIYSDLVQNIDFAPTFLDLAGVNLKDIKSEIDGVSLKKTLSGSDEPVHDYLFFELGYARGVTTKDWKYIAVRYDETTQKAINNGTTFKGYKKSIIKAPYYTNNSHLGFYASSLNPLYFDQNQLFDLKSDIRETKNVFKDNPEQVSKMKAMLSKTLKSFPKRPYGEFVN